MRVWHRLISLTLLLSTPGLAGPAWAAPADPGSAAEGQALPEADLDGARPRTPVRSRGVLLRLALGPLWQLTPDRGDAAFALDLVLRFPFAVGGDDPGFVFWPAVGYTYEDTQRAGHLVTLGLGLGYGGHVFAVAWVPRLVLGAPDGAFAAGWRHGLYAELLYGVMHVEVAHQVVYPGGPERHDLRFGVGVDLLAMARVVGAFTFLSWVESL